MWQARLGLTNPDHIRRKGLQGLGCEPWWSLPALVGLGGKSAQEVTSEFRMLESQAVTPIVVEFTDSLSAETTVADVLLQALGLTGAFIGATLLAGITIGLTLFKLRRIRRVARKAGMQGLGL